MIQRITTTDIREATRNRLRQSKHNSLQNLRCEFRGAQVTLRGRVCSCYQKRLAEAIVADIEGVESVVNEIEVFVTDDS